MTNKEFVNQIKEQQKMRSNTAINDIRQALKSIGVKTSAYGSRIDPHSAAWLLYATLIAPSTPKSEWIVKTAKLFEEKNAKGEDTPIDLLWDLFDNQESAKALDRITIDQVTGDVYAFAKKHPGQPVDILRYDFKENAGNRKPTMIQYLVQILGEYFQAYHEWNIKQN